MSLHYQRNLAGEAVPLHDAHPQAGYYKMRRGKGGPWMPVAIWEHEGQMIAVVGTGEANGRQRRDPDDIWTYCAGNPVSKADAKFAFEHGKWQGDAPTIGDNSREYPATYEGISAEFADYAELVRQFLADVERDGGIHTKVRADQASNMADKISGTVKNGIGKRADELREALVRPHLEAQREINGQFKPLVDEAKVLDRKLRDAATAWAKSEQDRLRKEAEEKARIEREKSPSAEIHIVPEVPKVQVGGERGAKRSLKTRRVARVTDYAAALAHFANSDEVRQAVEKLAQRAVDAKMPTPPGVEVVEEQKL